MNEFHRKIKNQPEANIPVFARRSRSLLKSIFARPISSARNEGFLTRASKRASANCKAILLFPNRGNAGGRASRMKSPRDNSMQATTNNLITLNHRVSYLSLFSPSRITLNSCPRITTPTPCFPRMSPTRENPTGNYQQKIINFVLNPIFDIAKAFWNFEA